MSIWTGLHEQSDDYLASLAFLFAGRLTTLDDAIDFQNGAKHSDIEAQKIRLENSSKSREVLNQFCDTYNITDEFERKFLSTFTHCLAAACVGLVGGSHHPQVVLESLKAYLARNDIDLDKVEVNYDLIRSNDIKKDFGIDESTWLNWLKYMKTDLPSETKWWSNVADDKWATSSEKCKPFTNLDKLADKYLRGTECVRITQSVKPSYSLSSSVLKSQKI